MSSFIRDEEKVGQMLRYLSGDIGIAFKNDMRRLYSYSDSYLKGFSEEERAELEDISERCAEWHWMIVKYAPDPVMTRKFVSILQYCLEYRVRPSELNAWKKLMRIYLPEQFLEKMSKFTQVPNLAIMDDGHEKRIADMRKDVRDSSEVLW